MLGGERALMANTGFHYLHHKHFECNYSGELLPIFDKWFGTFHDGSEQAHARLREHLAGRRY
jgi:sterol desaturase/sphingolipid hydroxylase (fatty acid hydroxylase superfamily)